jgi:hypothetical protein
VVQKPATYGFLGLGSRKTVAPGQLPTSYLPGGIVKKPLH